MKISPLIGSWVEYVQNTKNNVVPFVQLVSWPVTEGILKVLSFMYKKS